jgi:cytochrome P450
MRRADLPPGPSAPAAVQSVGFWTRPIAYMERCRARYGRRFTIRLVGAPPFVMVSAPEELREVFTAPPDVLHPGEGAQVLEPVVGSNSVILLDEGRHLAQRKLMLPAFHGEAMEKLEGLVAEVTDREVGSWPGGEPVVLHSRLQGLTLEVILRAVFGLDPGPRLEALRERLTAILEFGTSPLSLLPPLPIRSVGPGAEFDRRAREVDELLFELIHERRGETEGERPDILAMLLAARHEDGSPMSDQELRDELMTLLVAGHETTASSLAWAFERLSREPRVLARLSEADDDYVLATIQETLRRRPVLLNSAPRLTKQAVEIGGFPYPEGVCLVPNAYLVHHDPEIYPDPYAFRPERFLEESPGTYTWIPFGGGRRRCLGASFAILEMRIVLRDVIERGIVSGAGVETARRRAITISPRDGARVTLRPPTPAAQPTGALPSASL